MSIIIVAIAWVNKLTISFHAVFHCYEMEYRVNLTIVSSNTYVDYQLYQNCEVYHYLIGWDVS